MKLSRLLATRQNLNRQAHLANLAFCYFALKRLADRLAAARLHGRVKLLSAEPKEGRYWPCLIALEGHQSVIEEHVGDEDLLNLADAIAFALEGEFVELEFSLEELGEKYVAPLRGALSGAGIDLDLGEQLAADQAD